MNRLPCSNCSARRGVAEYSDGSYCYSCHKLTKNKSLIDKENKRNLNAKEILEKSTELPKNAVDYLNRYFIDLNQIRENTNFIRWSPGFSRILFIYNDNKSIWARSIKSNVKCKWLFIGEPCCFELKSKHSKSVIITEDIISAIRISPFENVISLGGTNHRSVSLIEKLVDYDDVFVWLDGDEAGKQAADVFKKEIGLFKTVRTIKSNKDPKEFTDSEIYDIVNVAIEA